MRDLFVLAIVFGSIPFCLTRPYIGILVWAWISYMNPHRLSWGIAYDFPVAQIVALAILAGFGLTVIRGQRLSLPMRRETVILILLWFQFCISTFFAMRPDWAWPEWQEITKILLVTFLTMILIDDEKKLRWFVLIIALSLGFYGVKGGLFSILTGGQSKVWGPPGSFFEDNNALALALNMVLPLLYYLSISEPNRNVKLALKGGFALTAIAVVFTYSRGGFLGLATVLGLIVLKSSLKVKVAVAVLILVAAPVVIQLVPKQWFDRMGTIQEYEEDESSMSRIAAWKVASLLAMDRPLTGGGFNAIDNSELYTIYNVESGLSTGVHSIYFEVLGESGFIALGLFLALIASTILSQRRLRKVLRDKPGFERLVSYSHMIEISVLGYAVSGAFLELSFFDLFYHLVAITVIMKNLAARELSRLEEGVPSKDHEDRTPAVNTPLTA